eukprot:CAMPEP_0201570474 /NCGR_PEP_ID=MMETSP0190_2-20130828/12766_1 /ASSEMBLY_ACC=CAM_ASM_000263 /TAXON_ID=37353 /ORGANISM="Rosalina sp." /LENGTH=230 /DNA_ID=CAMNT_0047994057 /DNA_START=426 /DNA_END=1115 /DNA_ORIENTATION=+
MAVHIMDCDDEIELTNFEVYAASHGGKQQEDVEIIRNPHDPVIFCGVVTYWNIEKGFGFITPNDGSGEVFVDYSEMAAQGFETLDEGERVEFEIIQDDGRRKAINVTEPFHGYVQGKSNEAITNTFNECTSNAGRDSGQAGGINNYRGGSRYDGRGRGRGGYNNQQNMNTNMHINMNYGHQQMMVNNQQLLAQLQISMQQQQFAIFYSNNQPQMMNNIGNNFNNNAFGNN